MLSDKEIFDAVNEAPLGRTGQGTVISVGRAIEAAVLAKLGVQMAQMSPPVDDGVATPYPINVYLRNAEDLAAFVRKYTPKAAA